MTSQPNYQNSPELHGQSTLEKSTFQDIATVAPGTRLDIRRDDNDQPLPGEYPLNAIDKACHAHDIAYKSNNLQQRHLADVKLIHALNAIPDKSFKEKLASWLVKSAMKGKLMFGAGN